MESVAEWKDGVLYIDFWFVVMLVVYYLIGQWIRSERGRRA